MNKFFVEEPKNMIINLIISFVVILATVAFAGLSGSDLVIQTAWYIFNNSLDCLFASVNF